MNTTPDAEILGKVETAELKKDFYDFDAVLSMRGGISGLMPDERGLYEAIRGELASRAARPLLRKYGLGVEP